MKNKLIGAVLCMVFAFGVHATAASALGNNDVSDITSDGTSLVSAGYEGYAYLSGGSVVQESETPASVPTAAAVAAANPPQSKISPSSFVHYVQKTIKDIGSFTRAW